MRGLLAEFDTPESLLLAVHKLRQQGYCALETHTPMPVEGLAEALGRDKSSALPKLVLIGGLCGAVTAYLGQYFCSAIDYPLNVGGRPLNSIPAFIPIVFELAVLFASLTCFAALLLRVKLPRLWRPVFESEIFERGSQDKFFLWIAAGDAKFDKGSTRKILKDVNAGEIDEVG